MAEIQGTCDDRFNAVRDVLAANLDNGQDVGASVAVVVDGELVVDIWGGVIDQETGAPWERDTLINVWSTTKTMAALSVLVLADRGEVDLYAPVADYWPEFKANGKEGVMVRHCMSHTAGVSGWVPPIAIEDLYDWDKATSALAAMEPLWEPGTASGYHAVTQGYLLGEIVRRVTGKSIGTFFAEEIAGPIGADFHIGTPAECDSRIARVIPPPDAITPDGLDPDSVLAKTFGSITGGLNAEVSWTEPWRRAEIPAANGHGNARSVALVQSAISNGGVAAGGTKLLSPDTIDKIFDVQAQGTDLVLAVPMKLGIGYGLTGEEIPLSPNRACFWGGWGGSIVVNDLDKRMTAAYVMNRMGEGTTGDIRGASIVFMALNALG
jgi:CubicO group peptidase (beta-lactamase class C family)